MGAFQSRKSRPTVVPTERAAGDGIINVGGPVIPNEFNIFFVRHGVSCANLLKAMGEKVKQLTYQDPSLTTKGRRSSYSLGKLMRNNLLDYYAPYMVCSSMLLRAQETATLMTQPEKLYIFPYISEYGYTYDNWAFNRNKQLSKLSKLVNDVRKTNSAFSGPLIDYSFFDSASGASSPSVSKFIDWFTKNYQNIYRKGKAENIVIFSHSGLIKDFIKVLTKEKPDNLPNNSAIYVKFRPMSDKKFTFEGYMDYRGSAIETEYPVAEKSNCDDTNVCDPQVCRPKFYNKTSKVNIYRARYGGPSTRRNRNMRQVSSPAPRPEPVRAPVPPSISAPVPAPTPVPILVPEPAVEVAGVTTVANNTVRRNITRNNTRNNARNNIKNNKRNNKRNNTIKNNKRNIANNATYIVENV